MQDLFKGLGSIVVYFLIEAAIIAGVVSTAWLLTLNNKLGIHLNFFDWYFIIFAFKLVRFDVFRFVDINNLSNKNKKNDDI